MWQDAPEDELLTSPASRLERGEVLAFEEAPFPHLGTAEAEFLRSLENFARQHRHISFDPASEKLSGIALLEAESRQRLVNLFQAFSAEVRAWLNRLLPEYRGQLQPDRVSFRPEEEAIRTVRWSARNDLLHIDSFPTRPTFGKRILRVYVNLNLVDDRVWAISEKYDTLLKRFQRKHLIPNRTRAEWLSVPSPWHRLLHGDWVARSHYDQFQLQLQHALRRDDPFQERAPRVYRHFAPQSCWLLFSDGVAHADLRGQFALEHSFLVPDELLVEPSHSPLNLLIERGGVSFLRKVG